MIAVTAITLLVSPVWVSVMRRVEATLTEGLESYRNALAVAYAQELREVGRGRAFVGHAVAGSRARLIAFNPARRERRRRKTERRAENKAAKRAKASPARSEPGDDPHP